MYSEVFESIRQIAERYSSPYNTIGIGALPVSEGLAMCEGPGSPRREFLDAGKEHSLTVILNGKDKSRVALISALDNIHSALTSRANYPSCATWEVTRVVTSGAPRYLDRELSDPRQWMYGSTLTITFYTKGDCIYA